VADTQYVKKLKYELWIFWGWVILGVLLLITHILSRQESGNYSLTQIIGYAIMMVAGIGGIVYHYYKKGKSES